MDALGYDLLFETRMELIEEITGLPDMIVNYQAAPNKWSIAQICHHLYLSERVFTRAIETGMQDRDYHHIIQKNIYLISDRSKKFRAPNMVLPSEEDFRLTALIDLLGQSRDHLLQLLYEKDPDILLNKKKAKHPLFGDLALDQWIELLSLHEQRHIGQIKDAKRI